MLFHLNSKLQAWGGQQSEWLQSFHGLGKNIDNQVCLAKRANSTTVMVQLREHVDLSSELAVLVCFKNIPETLVRSDRTIVLQRETEKEEIVVPFRVC